MEQFGLIFVSFLLYALFVLLPIIPAVVIFKLFPNTSLALSGPLQNFTLNATGAFGAYIATVLLGFSLVNRIDERIGGMAETRADTAVTTWQIEAPVELRDTNGQPIKEPGRMVEDLKVLLVRPEVPKIERSYPQVYVSVPLERGAEKRGQWPIARFSLPGFESSPLDLNVALGREGAVRDDVGHKLRVTETVVLKQLPELLVARPYAPEEGHLQPVPDGPSPPAPPAGGAGRLPEATVSGAKDTEGSGR